MEQKNQPAVNPNLSSDPNMRHIEIQAKREKVKRFFGIVIPVIFLVVFVIAIVLLFIFGRD